MTSTCERLLTGLRFGAIIKATVNNKERCMRDAILAKIAEISDMMVDATCDGRNIGEVDLVLNELMGIVGQLEQAVDYYVD
jgi:hypothetical protein